MVLDEIRIESAVARQGLAWLLACALIGSGAAVAFARPLHCGALSPATCACCQEAPCPQEPSTAGDSCCELTAAPSPPATTTELGGGQPAEDPGLETVAAGRPVAPQPAPLAAQHGRSPLARWGPPSFLLTGSLLI